MADVSVHLERNLARYEREGDADRVEKIKARLAAKSGEVSMSTKKKDLLAAADAAGVEVDESMTKAEILEALDG